MLPAKPSEELPAFAKTTPAAVRTLITAVWSVPWQGSGRKILAALASHDTMNHVWQSLKLDDEAAKGFIVRTFDAARFAILRCSLPEEDDSSLAWLITGGLVPHTNLHRVRALAHLLRQALEDTTDEARYRWPASVPLGILEQFKGHAEWTERVYAEMAEDIAGYFDGLGFVMPRNQADAAENAFSLMMTDYFEQELGVPFNDVTADLALVIFGKEVSAEAIRMRALRRRK
jgi:hypothetical protein